MRGLPLVLLVAALLLTPAALAGAQYQLLFSESASRFVAEGAAGEGETRGYRFVILQENVTRVEFVLTWAETGDGTRLSGPDRFSLVAQDPAGRPVGAPARGTGGELSLEKVVNPVPAPEAVDADALPGRVEAATAQEGQGEWRAWVKLEDAGNPAGARVDEGNAFRLVAIVHFYEGVPMRVVSFEGRPSGIAGAAADVPLPWALGLGGLLAAAGGLGAALVVQGRKPKPSPEDGLSPRGENASSPGR